MSKKKFDVQSIKAQLRKLISGLERNADSIAVQLYREGVKKAECGDAELCALAQYFANELDAPKGTTVTVCGSTGMTVAVYQPNDTVSTLPAITLPLPKRAIEFVDEFDGGQYGFLEAK